MNPESPYALDPRMTAFAGRNVEYYNRTWKAIGDPNQSNIKINVAAALFSGLWLLYRKLYLHFGLLMVVVILDIRLTIFLANEGLVPIRFIDAWDNIAPFVYAAVVGAFGNLWYFRRFQQRDKESLVVSPDPLVQEEFLLRRGGVSFLSPIAFLVALFLYIMWAMQLPVR